MSEPREPLDRRAFLGHAGVLGAAARTHSNGTPAERAWEFVGKALAARTSAGAAHADGAASSGQPPATES